MNNDAVYIKNLEIENEKLVNEVLDWRDCAKYDPMMEGPRFKSWDRSQMDRCRKKYIEKL